MTEKGDLISREALKDATKKLYNETLDGIVKFGIEKVYDLISNAPTVEAIPTELHEKILDKVEGELLECQSNLRSQGEWIVVSRNCWKCNRCQELTNEGKNFCPNCGADMRGKDNGKL